jgi:hypothetical protein
MKKSLLIAAITALVVAIPASSALATPWEYQRFDASVVGKHGTKKKPKAIRLNLHPFHAFGTEGGALNIGNKNTGATLESPFSTVFANIYMDKAIVFNTNSFPGCDKETVINAPDRCPKGSRVDVPSSAAGMLRPVDNTKGEFLPWGKQSGFPANQLVNLEIKTFVMNAYVKGGKRVKDTLALRVESPVSGGVVIEGKLQNVTGAAKKRYKKRMRFTIPDGLIQPAAGIVSQLVNFDSGVKAVSSKRKPLVGLGVCPKSKKLNFGYSGEYTINTTRAANGIDWVLVGDGKIINKTTRCK